MNLSKKVKKSLELITEYLEGSESKHFEEWVSDNPDSNPEDHIYNHNKRVIKWLKSTKNINVEEVRKEFISLINSCVEGYTGEWDSTGEGKDGFEAMANGLRELAKLFNVNVSEAKEI